MKKCNLTMLSALILLAATAAPALADEAPAINSGDTAWMMTSTALVLFMTLPGLALFYGGLVRRKNVLSVLAQCLGIAGLATAGTIDVEADRAGERLHIRMRNSGALAAQAQEGIGLRNTRERLRSLYGDTAHFSLAASDGGVLAILDLPWQAAP